MLCCVWRGVVKKGKGEGMSEGEEKEGTALARCEELWSEFARVPRSARERPGVARLCTMCVQALLVAQAWDRGCAYVVCSGEGASAGSEGHAAVRPTPGHMDALLHSVAGTAQSLAARPEYAGTARAACLADVAHAAERTRAQLPPFEPATVGGCADAVLACVRPAVCYSTDATAEDAGTALLQHREDDEEKDDDDDEEKEELEAMLLHMDGGGDAVVVRVCEDGAVEVPERVTRMDTPFLAHYFM